MHSELQELLKRQESENRGRDRPRSSGRADRHDAFAAPVELPDSVWRSIRSPVCPKAEPVSLQRALSRMGAEGPSREQGWACGRTPYIPPPPRVPLDRPTTTHNPPFERAHSDSPSSPRQSHSFPLDTRSLSPPPSPSTLAVWLAVARPWLGLALLPSLVRWFATCLATLTHGCVRSRLCWAGVISTVLRVLLRVTVRMAGSVWLQRGQFKGRWLSSVRRPDPRLRGPCCWRRGRAGLPRLRRASL